MASPDVDPTLLNSRQTKKHKEEVGKKSLTRENTQLVTRGNLGDGEVTAQWWKLRR